MFKKEMNQSVIFHLQDYFDSKGYKLEKTSEVICFRKKLNNGFQDIAITSTNYYDTHYLSFAYGKRVNEIEEVMMELEKYFEPNLFNLRKDSLTYAFSPRRILNDKGKKVIKQEKDVFEAVTTIKGFTENYAFSLYDFLDDLKKVDNQINGESNNFWLNDDNKNYGVFRFDVRRLVIAKLSKSHDEYKKFTDKLIAIEENRIEQIRLSDEKYKDLKNWFVPKIINHLEEIVK